MEKENSTVKPLAKLLSLKWTCITNITNESTKKMKNLDDMFNNFDFSLDELSAWQKRVPIKYHQKHRVGRHSEILIHGNL